MRMVRDGQRVGWMRGAGDRSEKARTMAKIGRVLVWRDSQIVVAVRSRVDAGDAGTRYVIAARSPASMVHVLPGATRTFA